jgi:hypothetical protein
MDICFEGLNISISTFCVCADGFQGLSKVFHYTIVNFFCFNNKTVFRHVNFEVTKAVIVASPGFVKQQFFDYMYQQVGALFSAYIATFCNFLTLYIILFIFV